MGEISDTASKLDQGFIENIQNRESSGRPILVAVQRIHDVFYGNTNAMISWDIRFLLERNGLF